MRIFVYDNPDFPCGLDDSPFFCFTIFSLFLFLFFPFCFLSPFAFFRDLRFDYDCVIVALLFRYDVRWYQRSGGLIFLAQESS